MTSDLYEGTLRMFAGERERAERGRVVLRDSDVTWRETRQGRVAYYLHDRFVTDSAVADWRVFAQEIVGASGRHRHQGSTVIYVRRGRGATVVNGVEYPWQAGDVVMLPVLPGGVDHQHFSIGAERCEWVALVYGPFHRALGSMFGQIADSPRWRGERAEDVPAGDRSAATGTPPDTVASPRCPHGGAGERAGPGASPDVPAWAGAAREQTTAGTLWEDLEQRAERAFARTAAGRCVSSRADAPVEQVPGLGVLRWYMHPRLSGLALSSLYVAELEVAPGDCTAWIRHPGNIIGLVTAGNGAVCLDGHRHRWGPRDVLGLPATPTGVTFRLCADGDAPARIILAFPNWDSALGPGLGVGVRRARDP